MNYKRYVPYLLVALATVLIVLGIRAAQSNSTNKLFSDYELSQGLLTEPENSDGRDWLVPPNYVFDTGLTEEQLPALNDPTFTSVQDADIDMSDEVPGIHVEMNGNHRFYSNQVLNWHEVVNDSFEGKDIAITLCTLCRSGIVYDRVFDGKTIEMGNELKNYANSSILNDNKTNNLWLQGRGISISGKNIGEKLTVIDSESITWAEFRKNYPEGEVLSFDTGFDREYARHPYTSYDNNGLIYFPIPQEAEELTDKWIVNILEGETETIAFASEIEKGFGATNGELDGAPVVALWDFEGESLRVFNAFANDQTLELDYSFATETYTDIQTGSEWTAEGLAIDGELEGTQLDQLNAPQFFWFSWYTLNPDTKIARVESVEGTDAEEGEPETDNGFQIDADSVQVEFAE